jgi:signal transduction histidine kinase
MDLFTASVVLFATGMALTISIFGAPLWFQAPKNQPTIILMSGVTLCISAFVMGSALVLIETSKPDFGTQSTASLSILVAIAPLVYICFMLQALFLRSTRKSIFDLKALLIAMLFIGQLGLGVFIFKQTELSGSVDVTLDFIRSLYRGFGFSLLMGWIYVEARKKFKEQRNFLLNFIQIFSGICMLQSLAWVALLVLDFSGYFGLNYQFEGRSDLNMINSSIRAGIFFMVQVLISIYWSQHYSLSAIQERQKQERIQTLLSEKDVLIRSLSTSKALIESGALSAGLAHEFNQFLARIEMNADEALHLINDSVVKPNDLKRPLGNILKANHSAAQLVVNLKKLFQSGPAEAEPCQVDHLVRDVVSLYANRFSQASIQIDLDLRVNEQCLIWGHLFRQVLVNLLSNAIEALATSGQTNKLIRIESRVNQERQYCLVITDNGPGIRPEQESEMFNMFATFKPAGTGVGLWLSRYIVERHQGSLFYENLPKQGGVSFVITIPVESVPR